MNEYIRYLLFNLSEQTQFAKCWVVAISLPIMVTYPTEISLEKQTVPVGSNLALELLIPHIVGMFFVLSMTFPFAALMS